MAVMDLAPPPVAMIAISGTWGDTEQPVGSSAGEEKTRSNRQQLRTMEEESWLQTAETGALNGLQTTFLRVVGCLVGLGLDLSSKPMASVSEWP